MHGRSVLGAELLSQRADHATERRVHVVVVPADDLRLDERVGGQAARFGVFEELASGEEVGGETGRRVAGRG